jgi:hypothetical protein
MLRNTTAQANHFVKGGGRFVMIRCCPGACRQRPDRGHVGLDMPTTSVAIPFGRDTLIIIIIQRDTV